MAKERKKLQKTGAEIVYYFEKGQIKTNIELKTSQIQYYMTKLGKLEKILAGKRLIILK